VLGLIALASSAGAQRHPAQRIPETSEFPTGPAVGERLPDFTLPNQRGEKIDFHADRAGHKAAVVFQRSAVW
jgi:cytochrome oxidase Cu insertion factor (SCO1/SenC/PrrC family)